MPAKVFPCYPFANDYEEKVTNFLAHELDKRFYLIHNIVSESLNPKHMHKEIDLCIISTDLYLKLIEIKGYGTPPQLTDLSMISDWGAEDNPVVTMERYGKRLMSFLRREGIKLTPKGYLVLKNKDPQKIHGQWRRQCLSKEELLNELRREPILRKPSPETTRTLDLIREKYLCNANIEPFTGFDGRDFDSLRDSAEYARQGKDKNFKEEVLKPLYYKFRCMAYDIRSYLSQKGFTLFQHIMSPEQTMPQPIFWGAFTLRDIHGFLSDPQVGFHISTKDWFESGERSEDHFALKLAFFHSSEWMRRLMLRFKENPSEFVKLVREKMRDVGYRLTSSRDPNENFISTPISSSNLQKDLEQVAKLVLDDGIKLRSICFERPLFYLSNENLTNWDQLKKTVGHDFEMLLDLLKALLPEYIEEAKKGQYG
jgi:hypothetical protein